MFGFAFALTVFMALAYAIPWVYLRYDGKRWDDRAKRVMSEETFDEHISRLRREGKILPLTNLEISTFESEEDLVGFPMRLNGGHGKSQWVDRMVIPVQDSDIIEAEEDLPVVIGKLIESPPPLPQKINGLYVVKPDPKK